MAGATQRIHQRRCNCLAHHGPLRSGFRQVCLQTLATEATYSTILSLHATFLRNRIIGALRSSHDGAVRQAANNVPQNMVYDYSTLSELAIAVAALVDPTTVGVQKDHLRLIQELVDKYSTNIVPPSYKNDPTNTGSLVVLLTGSTGNVGSHVLAALLTEPRVAKVYTLNRGAAAVAGGDRQRAAFEARGLPTALLDGAKVVQLYGDLTRNGLGLDADVLKEVCWPVTLCSTNHSVPCLPDYNQRDAYHSQRMASRLQPSAVFFRQPHRRNAAPHRLLRDERATRQIAFHIVHCGRAELACIKRVCPRDSPAGSRGRCAHRVRRVEVRCRKRT